MKKSKSVFREQDDEEFYDELEDMKMPDFVVEEPTPLIGGEISEIFSAFKNANSIEQLNFLKEKLRRI